MKAPALALALAATFGLSCIEANAPQKPRGLDVRDVVTPDGTALEVACVPSGIELCFDATDNNCNGLIDEGCGVRTGLLQFVVAWDAAEADIDLEVTDPEGEQAEVGAQTLAGLVKDRDCPQTSGTCFGQNLENVYLGESELAKGRYKVVVRLDKLGTATAPVKVRLGVRLGGMTRAFRFELSPGDKTDRRSFEFTL